MSRPTPTDWQPVNPSDIGSDRPIKASVETDLLENIHWLYLEDRPPLIATVFSEASGYAVGAGSMSINGMWTREMLGDPFDEYEVEIAWANTDPTNDGTIRLDVASDPYNGTTGTGVDITATANTSAWQVSTATLPVDSSQAVDTIRMWLESPAGGEVRVHSIEVRPKRPSAIAAGVDGHGFTPMDSTEVDADSPLTVHHRQVQVDNLEVIRKVRTDTILGWSEDFRVRASGGTERFATDFAFPVTIITIPFRTAPGQNSLKWALIGYHTGGGAGAGKVTMYVESAPSSTEEVDLQGTWTSPFTAAIHRWDDGGQAAIACRDNGWDRLVVQLEGNGTWEGRLFSLCVWFDEAD